jgi:hypothetical protein
MAGILQVRGGWQVKRRKSTFSLFSSWFDSFAVDDWKETQRALRIAIMENFPSVVVGSMARDTSVLSHNVLLVGNFGLLITSDTTFSRFFSTTRAAVHVGE